MALSFEDKYKPYVKSKKFSQNAVDDLANDLVIYLKEHRMVTKHELTLLDIQRVDGEPQKIEKNPFLLNVIAEINKKLEEENLIEDPDNSNDSYGIFILPEHNEGYTTAAICTGNDTNAWYEEYRKGLK